ncbi:MAG: hypothetical protein EXR71_06445 [Myxococcales bacterium]|nr:hypothetical protein [Myxococcales bacterium]
MLSSLLVAISLTGFASAATLEPQVRIHLGANYVGGPAPFGVSAGMDARLTRLVGIDLGGFVTPGTIAEEDRITRSNNADYFSLRHGIYFAPGLRIPHPQPRRWAWEIFIRAGAGAVWYADTKPGAYSLDGDEYPVTAAMGGMGGADAFVRVGIWGVRVAGRAWLYEGQHPQSSTPALLVQPQVSLEGIVQF